MAGDRDTQRLEAVEIDEASLAPASREVEHERQSAIFDLLEDNFFHPVEAPPGPYDLKIALIDNRLALDIAGAGLRRSGTCCRSRPCAG